LKFSELYSSVKPVAEEAQNVTILTRHLSIVTRKNCGSKNINKITLMSSSKLEILMPNLETIVYCHNNSNCQTAKHF